MGLEFLICFALAALIAEGSGIEGFKEAGREGRTMAGRFADRYDAAVTRLKSRPRDTFGRKLSYWLGRAGVGLGRAVIGTTAVVGTLVAGFGRGTARGWRNRRQRWARRRDWLQRLRNRRNDDGVQVDDLGLSEPGHRLPDESQPGPDSLEAEPVAAVDPADPATEPVEAPKPVEAPLVPAASGDAEVIPLAGRRRQPQPPAVDPAEASPSPEAGRQPAGAREDWIAAAERLQITCHGWPAVVDGLRVNGDEATTWAQCESRAFGSPGQTGCNRQWEINMRSTPDGRVVVVSVRMTHRGADPRNPEPRDYTPTGKDMKPSRDAWIVYARNHLPRCGTCGVQSRLDPDNNHPHLRIADDGMSATVGAVAGPGCGSRYQIAMRAIRDGDICHIVHATTRAQPCTNSSASPTSDGGSTMSTPTGEVTGLGTAKAQAQTWSEELVAGVPQLETFGAYLSGAEVTDPEVFSGIGEAQEHLTAAAAAMGRVHGALERHTAVTEAYAASGGAGSKEHVTAE